MKNGSNSTKPRLLFLPCKLHMYLNDFKVCACCNNPVNHCAEVNMTRLTSFRPTHPCLSQAHPWNWQWTWNLSIQSSHRCQVYLKPWVSRPWGSKEHPTITWGCSSHWPKGKWETVGFVYFQGSQFPEMDLESPKRVGFYLDELIGECLMELYSLIQWVIAIQVSFR